MLKTALLGNGPAGIRQAPDSHEPLYDRIPQPYGELFVMNADGSGQRPLTDNGWEDATPAWQPEMPQH